MKSTIFSAALVTVTTALPVADPQWGLGGALGNLAGNVVGGVTSSVIGIPLSLVTGFTGGLIGGVSDGLGSIIGSILPIRVVQNEKGELVGVFDQSVVDSLNRVAEDQKQQ